MEESKDIMQVAKKPSLQELIKVAEQLVQSKMCPFKEPADAVLVLQAAIDVGVPFTTALANFYPIEGRVTAGVHIHESLAMNHPDALFEIVEDYVEVYHYRARGGFTLILSADQLQEGLLSKKYQIITVETDPKDYWESAIQLIKIFAPYMPEGVEDRRTKIKFTRKLKGIEGVVEYYLHESYQAGLIQARAHTWGKYTRAMCYSRCFTRGSNRYFGDIIKGLAETSELADATNVNYNVDDKGHVTDVEYTDYEEDANTE